jgi:hypothetical protein
MENYLYKKQPWFPVYDSFTQNPTTTLHNPSKNLDFIPTWNLPVKYNSLGFVFPSNHWRAIA